MKNILEFVLQIVKVGVLGLGAFLRVVQWWWQQMNRQFRNGNNVGGWLWLAIGLCPVIMAFSAWGNLNARPSISARPTAVAVAVQATSTRRPTPTTPQRTEVPTKTPRPEPTITLATEQVHTVEAGDNLGAIAAQYDVTVEALAAANGIDDPNRIAVGDELVIPAATDTEPEDESPATLANNGVDTLQMPDGVDPAVVDRVIDGDTVDVWLEDGSLIRLRLIGLDTPETVDPNTPEECFGREASDQAKLLLPERQQVYLEADDSQGDTDRYDRYLRYLWLEDGTMFNYEMVAEGYAIEYTYDLPYRYQAQFREAQRTAAENGLGLWDVDTCDGNADLPADGDVVPVPELPTATPLPIATDTPLPIPTTTAVPELPTTTPLPVVTDTPLPIPTATAVPLPTDTPLPPPTEVPPPPPPPTAVPAPPSNCDPSYPTVCIPPPPPDLDCGDIPYRRFQVVGSDPHRFDGDNDGIGCES